MRKRVRAINEEKPVDGWLMAVLAKVMGQVNEYFFSELGNLYRRPNVEPKLFYKRAMLNETAWANRFSTGLIRVVLRREIRKCFN